MTSTFTDPPRFWQQIAALTALLALLFAALQPPPTAHLGFFMAVLAWAAHIGLGMLCALAATRLLLRLRPALARLPWTILLLGGLAGSLLFAPIALGLEALLPAPPPDPQDDTLDAWEAAGGLPALAAEWRALLPSYLPAWLLINAMPMLRMSQPQLNAIDTAGPDNRAVPDLDSNRAAWDESAGAADHPAARSGGLNGGTAIAAAVPAPDRTMPVAASADTDGAMPPALVPAGPTPTPALTEGLLDRLPLAIGRQLVSISSDLHYLQVVTRRGRATVLGSLAEAESELGRRGLRIHRSHWVALDAIRRLHRNAQGWRCELHDGRSLPVSRRRAAEIKERLGRDFVIEG